MDGNSYLFIALKATILFYGLTVRTAHQQSAMFQYSFIRPAADFALSIFTLRTVFTQRITSVKLGMAVSHFTRSCAS